MAKRRRPSPIILTELGMIDIRNVVHVTEYGQDDKLKTQIGIEACDDITITWDSDESRSTYIKKVYRAKSEWFHFCADKEDAKSK